MIKIIAFEKEVRDKAILRVKFEGMEKDDALVDKNSPYF